MCVDFAARKMFGGAFWHYARLRLVNITVNMTTHHRVIVDKVAQFCSKHLDLSFEQLKSKAIQYRDKLL